MSKVITIVIPTYNMEEFLTECLDSLQIQDLSLQNCLEVLIVNDGSKDKSSEIAHKYESQVPDVFRVIDKENGGHGSCCNVGLQEAKGEFIHFLDSDDWLDKNLSLFVEKLKTEKSDVVFTRRVDEYYESGESKIHSSKVKYGEKEVDARTFDYSNLNSGFFCIHECTFRTSLLRQNGIRFRERVSYDDTILRFAAFPNCKSFSFYDMELYHYRLGRAGQSMDPSVMNKKIDQLFLNIQDLYQYANNIKEQVSENQMQYVKFELYNYFHSLIWNTLKLERKTRKRLLCKYLSFFKQSENYYFIKGNYNAKLFYLIPSNLLYWLSIPLVYLKKQMKKSQ